MTARAVAAFERASVIEEARAWLGTPFHHRARLKNVGVDCVNFLAACYLGAGVISSVDVGFYTPEWFCHETGADLERFVRGVRQYFAPSSRPSPGDLVLFRYGRAESHGALLVAPDLVIHASGQRRCVVEEEIGPGTPLETRRTGTWTPKRWADEARA